MKRILLLIVTLACLGAKPHSGSSTWELKYSSGVRLDSGASVSFVFPAPNGHVNYLMKGFSTPMTQAQSVTMTVRLDILSGAPVFNYLLQPDNICVNYASVRTHFVGVFQGRKQFDEVNLPSAYRWWSNPTGIELIPGTFSVTTPLTPDQWSDGSGSFGTEMVPLYGYDYFGWSVSHPFQVGLTFGGGCFFGHGVNVSGGTARFTLVNYTIQ